MSAFDEALEWHEQARITSPKARSYRHTQAILNELNEALALLKLTKWSDDTTENARRKEDFLTRHSRAPYGRT